MSGGDYIRGKHAMSIFTKALQRLQFQRFLGLLEQSSQIGTFAKKIQEAGSSPERVKLAWRECKKDVKEVLRIFSAFREEGRNCSKQFIYWDNFLTQISRVIRDLTPSHRECNWELHFSATSFVFVFCIR